MSQQTFDIRINEEQRRLIEAALGKFTGFIVPPRENDNPDEVELLVGMFRDLPQNDGEASEHGRVLHDMAEEQGDRAPFVEVRYPARSTLAAPPAPVPQLVVNRAYLRSLPWSDTPVGKWIDVPLLKGTDRQVVGSFISAVEKPTGRRWFCQTIRVSNTLVIVRCRRTK